MPLLSTHAQAIHDKIDKMMAAAEARALGEGAEAATEMSAEDASLMAALCGSLSDEDDSSDDEAVLKPQQLMAKLAHDPGKAAPRKHTPKNPSPVSTRSPSRLSSPSRRSSPPQGLSRSKVGGEAFKSEGWVFIVCYTPCWGGGGGGGGGEGCVGEREEEEEKERKRKRELRAR